MLARASILFIIVLIFACKPNKTTEHPLLNYVPEDASIIIKINNLTAFQSELKNNSFLSDAAQTETVKTIKTVFGVLNHIQIDSTNLLALVEKDTPHILLISHAQPTWTVENDSIKPANDLKGIIQKRMIGDIPVFTREQNGIHILSTSKNLIKSNLNTKEQLVNDELLSNLYQTSSSQKSASVFINTKSPAKILPYFTRGESSDPSILLADWITFDLNSNQRYLNLNGLTRVKDTSTSFLRLFEGTKPVQNITPTIASAGADAILSYTFDEYETFAQNQKDYLNSPYSINTSLNTVEEVGVIYQNGQRAVVLSTYASEGVQTFLDKITIGNTDYQGHEIVRLSENKFLIETFQPLINQFEANFYTVLDDRYVFSDNTSILEKSDREF